MSKSLLKRVAIALVFTGGLFFILFLGWKELSARYTTEVAPDSFAVLSFLEKNPFYELKGVNVFDLADKPVNIGDIGKGKIVILNFWASWCEPCAEEFPSMLKLLKEYHENVVILAVSNDSAKGDIETFSKAFGLLGVDGMHLLWDKDLHAAKAFQVGKLPESYIFGRDGKLLRKIVGTRDWANADAMAYFKMLLEPQAE
ncbi:MAG: TlpA family protein disulfide reductase [Bdellovibrionaceae bacterium]|nr:TlpA family protein disulfide reductase [Pseudobdellovibrionaceae bacterium]